MAEAPTLGAPTAAVRAALGVPRLAYHDVVDSTMDEAHALAEAGAAAGTTVLAAAQRAGRGRGGRPWLSEPDAGLWFTVLERPADEGALAVLALRVGLHLADALTSAVHGPISLKWPNDLLVGPRKLAGVLIEVRWRDGRPEWVAIGVGINRRIPDDYPLAAAVRADVSRDELLLLALPAVRSAAQGTGALSEAELDRWRRRDAAAGRRVREPLAGVVEGIAADGALLVRDDAGITRAALSGSLLYSD